MSARQVRPPSDNANLNALTAKPPPDNAPKQNSAGCRNA